MKNLRWTYGQKKSLCYNTSITEREGIMKKTICFFEPDESLAGKLIDYWLGHGFAGYRISYYSDEEKWLADYASITADLWILDRSLEKRIPKRPTGRILWWTDRPEDTEAIFKYRSAAVLLHTVQGYLTAEGTVSGAGVISLYSPVKRCGQTTFGITLSQLLSRKGRILYLNLEGYSGLERIFSDSYSKDISDFIYYVNQTSENIPLIIQKFVYRLGEADMIPPVLNPTNLQDITEEKWLYTLDILKNCGLYDYIVLDISDFVHGIFSILRESQVIFSAAKADAGAEAKWQQYSSILIESGYGDVLEKTRKLEMPHMAVYLGSPEGYIQGPMAELVEEAAREAGIL